MANTTQNVAAPDLDERPFYAVERTEVTRVVILGVLLGVLTPLLGMLISNYFIAPIFCRADNFSLCATGGIIGYNSALVILSLLAVALLNNWGIFRPLIVALGVAVSLWGFKEYVDPLTSGNWVEFYVFSAFLFAVVYVLFYWLMRLRNFAFSLGLAIVTMVLIRWVLVS